MIIETLRSMWVISLGESIVIEGILGIAHSTYWEKSQ
jgi:hypothetical protein